MTEDEIKEQKALQRTLKKLQWTDEKKSPGKDSQA